MASYDYIPGSDDGFRMWATCFGRNLAAKCGVFGIGAADAAEIVSSVERFEQALLTATCEPTRTRATIALKDEARATCETLCRRWATRIRRDDSIADGDKIAAGVPVKDRDHGKPIPCPRTPPLLNVSGGGRGNHRVTYADSQRPTSRARPYGAKSLELAIEIMPQHAAPLSEVSRRERITRNPIVVEFDKADDGAVATYYGRWAGARGEKGPWSGPVSLRIAA